MSNIHNKLGRKYRSANPKMLKMAETKHFMNIKLFNNCIHYFIFKTSYNLKISQVVLFPILVFKFHAFRKSCFQCVYQHRALAWAPAHGRQHCLSAHPEPVCHPQLALCAVTVCNSLGLPGLLSLLVLLCCCCWLLFCFFITAD